MKTHAQIQAHAKERGHELMPVEIDLVVNGTTFHEELSVAYTVVDDNVLIHDHWSMNQYGRYAGFPYTSSEFENELESYIREALGMGDKEGVDPDEAFETDHADRHRDLRRDQV